ncbi:hypothetical protein FE257_011270 [Aspergillus nanangensis]|uniref:Uncharacterized protein n=1 Tax=Aspergillus nanangensis TaxID=2582783 RepID=A0AAD4GRK0_ASPNN|nr:hypothetical protein FE257_011270 [Aspergillus nanangensis]
MPKRSAKAAKAAEPQDISNQVPETDKAMIPVGAPKLTQKRKWSLGANKYVKESIKGKMSEKILEKDPAPAKKTRTKWNNPMRIKLFLEYGYLMRNAFPEWGRDRKTEPLAHPNIAMLSEHKLFTALSKASRSKEITALNEKLADRSGKKSLAVALSVRQYRFKIRQATRGRRANAWHARWYVRKTAPAKIKEEPQSPKDEFMEME